ncbi:MAG: YitT family protein [Bacteroidaceae bacterium]
MLHYNIIKFNFKNVFHDFLFIMLGTLIYACGYVFFQLPYQLVPGGTAGAAALVFYATTIPVQYTYWAFNVILLMVALKFLGFKFLLNTICGVLSLGSFMALLQLFARINEEGKFVPLLDNMFMSCLIGAAFEGIGLAIVFINSGSTGGTDIIAAVVNKFRDVSLGQIILCTDVCIISTSYLIFEDINLLIYSYVTLIITTVTLDYVVNNRRQSVQFFIFSEKFDEIAREIASTGRGVTIVNGIGWYTKEERKVLIVLARRRESPFIFRVIKEADPNAFVSQSKVVGVFGNGFDRIKGK